MLGSEAIERVQAGDDDTVALMKAQVAGLPTEGVPDLARMIEQKNLLELGSTSQGDCLYNSLLTAQNMDRVGAAGRVVGEAAAGMRRRAMKVARGNGILTAEEAAYHAKQGITVEHKQIQAAATTLGCTIHTHNARPAAGEPRKDAVAPHGSVASTYTINLVPRSAHYSPLVCNTHATR